MKNKTSTEQKDEPCKPTIRVNCVLLEVSEHFVDLVLWETMRRINLRIETDSVSNFRCINEDSALHIVLLVEKLLSSVVEAISKNSSLHSELVISVLSDNLIDDFTVPILT